MQGSPSSQTRGVKMQPRTGSQLSMVQGFESLQGHVQARRSVEEKKKKKGGKEKTCLL